MSVDSVYFCSDLQRAELWWQQPIHATIGELRDWRQPTEDDFFGLVDEEFVQGDFISQLDQLAAEHDGKRSLAEICQLAVDSMLKSDGEKRGGILSRMKSERSQRASELQSLIYVGSCHSILVNLSRQGPVAEPANTKATDMWFSEFLERYLPANEAQYYNGSHTNNLLGPCTPPQFEGLGEEILEKLELRMEMPYRVDAEVWLGRWEKLEGIPGLWNTLKGKGMKPAAIRHIRSIGNLCRFAVDNQLAMLKVFI